jgi:hypothetical protein
MKATDNVLRSELGDQLFALAAYALPMVFLSVGLTTIRGP